MMALPSSPAPASPSVVPASPVVVNGPASLYSERGDFPPPREEESTRAANNERHMTATTGKLRWGILGVARINERLLPAFARSAHAEVRAVASRSPDRARAAAAARGIPRWHGSYEALLDDPEVQAVYVPLPNTLHAEWARR